MSSASVGVLLVCIISFVTSSLVPVVELFPPKPYKFGYTIKDKDGEQYHEKVGQHDVEGSYGSVDDRGIKRLIADKGTEVKTGTTPMGTAGLRMSTLDANGSAKKKQLSQFQEFYKSMADVYKASLVSAKKDFFKDAVLAKKMKDKKTEVEDSKMNVDLLELYKLGFVLPGIFEMYGVEKGLMTPSSVLDYLKYLAPEELLLSLFSDQKGTPEKDLLLTKSLE